MLMRRCFTQRLCVSLNCMRYRELAISVKREYLEGMEAALIGEGFGSMQIDDPSDVQDILDHKELYKYDYSYI